MSTYTVKQLTALTILYSALTFGQFNFDRYESARLDTLSFFPTHLLNDSVYFIVLDTNMPLKSEVVYKDSIRPIDNITKEVITDWMTEVIMDSSSVDLFKHELLVYQNKVPLWIPVQEQLIPFFKEELIKNDVINIYVTVAGATKYRVIFTINEFTK